MINNASDINFTSLNRNSIFEERQPILNRMASFAPKKVQPIIVIVLLLLFIPVVFGLPIILMFVMVLLYKTNIFYGLAMSLPLVLGLIILYKRQRRVEKNTKNGLTNFARDNGWRLKPVGQLVQSFNYGRYTQSANSSNAILYSIQGTIKQRNFELLVGWKSDKRGSLEPLIPQLFVENRYELPDMVLISRHTTDNSAIFDNAFIGFKNPDKISLEGDFDNHFQLYVPAGEHIAAMSMIAPDFMQQAVDFINEFSVFTSGKSISLLPRVEDATSRRTIEKMFEASIILLTETED